MRISLGVPDQAAHAVVLTIGNFDGVHLGHKAMMKLLLERASSMGLPSAVLTFEPHPREYFRPDQAPARLTSLRERLTLLDACGVEQTTVMRFNKANATISAHDFVEKILCRGLGAKHVLVGEDFRFGRGREGDFSLLLALGQQYGFTVEALPSVDFEGQRVSSSAIRAALAHNDLALAGALLGRPYAIAGRIVHGDKIGRQLGFPTANVQLKRKKVPLDGVFAVMVSGLDKRHLPGAASVGVRPTIRDGLKPVLEVYLLDFDREIYGAHVTVHFLHQIRGQEKFASLDALRDQIAADVAETQAYFSGREHG